MNALSILGLALAGISGGLAAYFGGIGGLVAVITAQLSMMLIILSK